MTPDVARNLTNETSPLLGYTVYAHLDPVVDQNMGAWGDLGIQGTSCFSAPAAEQTQTMKLVESCRQQAGSCCVYLKDLLSSEQVVSIASIGISKNCKGFVVEQPLVSCAATVIVSTGKQLQQFVHALFASKALLQGNKCCKYFCVAERHHAKYLKGIISCCKNGLLVILTYQP